MIRGLFCLATGHSVNRHRVWHDGQNYRTRCVKCSKPLIRDHGHWRGFDAARDANEHRQPHPYKEKDA